MSTTRGRRSSNEPRHLDQEFNAALAAAGRRLEQKRRLKRIQQQIDNPARSYSPLFLMRASLLDDDDDDDLLDEGEDNVHWYQTFDWDAYDESDSGNSDEDGEEADRMLFTQVGKNTTRVKGQQRERSNTKKMKDSLPRIHARRQQKSSTGQQTYHQQPGSKSKPVAVPPSVISRTKEDLSRKHSAVLLKASLSLRECKSPNKTSTGSMTQCRKRGNTTVVEHQSSSALGERRRRTSVVVHPSAKISSEVFGERKQAREKLREELLLRRPKGRKSSSVIAKDFEELVRKFDEQDEEEDTAIKSRALLRQRQMTKDKFPPLLPSKTQLKAGTEKHEGAPFDRFHTRQAHQLRVKESARIKPNEFPFLTTSALLEGDQRSASTRPQEGQWVQDSPSAELGIDPKDLHLLPRPPPPSSRGGGGGGGRSAVNNENRNGKESAAGGRRSFDKNGIPLVDDEQQKLTSKGEEMDNSVTPSEEEKKKNGTIPLPVAPVEDIIKSHFHRSLQLRDNATQMYRVAMHRFEEAERRRDDRIKDEATTEGRNRRQKYRQMELAALLFNAGNV